MIVMTDGRSNVEAFNTIPQADAAKNANIRVMSVGLSAGKRLQTLPEGLCHTLGILLVMHNHNFYMVLLNLV